MRSETLRQMHYFTASSYRISILVPLYIRNRSAKGQQLLYHWDSLTARNDPDALDRLLQRLPPLAK
jgi:hypothetical protein